MGAEEGTSNGGGRKYGAEDNGFGAEVVHDSGDGSSGASDSFRTYKRRRRARSASIKRVQDDGRTSVEAACHLADQTHLTGMKSLSYFGGHNTYPQRHQRNVVLEQIYQSLSGDEGGIQRCIHDALFFNPKLCSAVKETHVCHEDRDKCPSLTEKIPNGTQHAAEGEYAMSGHSVRESDNRTVTEMCQRVFFSIMISEKFSSLCKLLFENFQGIKAENLFHISLINKRMKEGAYENSPMLFAADIDQVWRKLQEIGTELVSLSKSLSDIARASYSEQVVCAQREVDQEKHEFVTREAGSHVKAEPTEACGVYKICSCRQCGRKADGVNCFVCDSCEEMYHIACIEPSVKEIPPKSWYCTRCTANGLGSPSPHEDCVVCKRLNGRRTLGNQVAGESFPTNPEACNEFEENSNSSLDNGLQLSTGSEDLGGCNICASKIRNGEKFRICEHPHCYHKYYHERCLTMVQLKIYGPCWYCPSCLCRACLTDKDDDKIVLCDSCDAAYHIYCMNPPRNKIPRGNWFCRKCEAGIQRIRKAKRAYQNLEKKQKIKCAESKMAYEYRQMKLGEKTREDSDKGRGGMDMLLTAAKTLNFEEKLAAINMKS